MPNHSLQLTARSTLKLPRHDSRPSRRRLATTPGPPRLDVYNAPFRTQETKSVVALPHRHPWTRPTSHRHLLQITKSHRIHCSLYKIHRSHRSGGLELTTYFSSTKLFFVLTARRPQQSVSYRFTAVRVLHTSNASPQKSKTVSVQLLFSLSAIQYSSNTIELSHNFNLFSLFSFSLHIFVYLTTRLGAPLIH